MGDEDAGRVVPPRRRAAAGAAAAEAIEVFKLGYANRTLGLRPPEKTRKAGADIRARLERLGVYRESGHEHLNGSLVLPLFDAAGQVVNCAAFTPGACEELIVCEALIDAIQASGAKGGLKRVLIAFDRDDAGERGAAKFAERLMALGIDCFLQCWRLRRQHRHGRCCCHRPDHGRRTLAKTAKACHAV